jgi:hypothetical protein
MEIMSDIYSAAAFLRKNVPCVRRLSAGRKTREFLLMRLSWHAALHSLCMITKDEKIEAVGCARAIKDPLDSRFPERVNETGKILYVENIASKTTEGMKNLLRFVMCRWPNCEYIMFRRPNSGMKNKIYPMNKFLKKAKVI